MILKKVEGRRNPRAWHGSRLAVSGLHGHPSSPNPRPKRRVETPGDPWGVPQPPGPSSPAYWTPTTANRWFLPLSSSQWGQTLPTTSVMFPVRIEPRGHAQGGKKIPGLIIKPYIQYTCFWFLMFDNYLYFGLYLYAQIHFLLHINVFERASYNVFQQNSNIHAPCI